MSKAASRKRARSAPKAPRRRRPVEMPVERLTALGRLTRLIASATDSDAAFRAIAEAATTLLDATATYVWVDAGGETLREGASYWAGPERSRRTVPTTPIPRNASIAGAVLASRRLEYVPDIQRDPRWHHTALAASNDLHGCLALPLLHQDRAVGALIVVFGRRGDVTAEEKDVARLLADQAAIAIDNARLYEDAGRRQREAELLAAVVRTINTSLDLTTVLQSIAEGARGVCRSDMAFIALLDRATNVIGFRHWPGATYQGYGALRIGPGEGAAGQVLASGRPLRTDNYLTDSRVGKQFTDIARMEGIRAYMAAPITIDGRGEGFLAVANRDDRRLIDRDEQILLGLADHAAVAIKNAQLFARERASEARKGAILTAALDCIITIDHQGRIVEFNPAAERAFGCTAADALGREMAELIVPPALREQYRRGLAHHLATDHGPVIGRRLEITAMRADGSEFPVELAIIAIPTDGPPMFTAFLRDISERRRAEEVLHQSEAQMRQSQKMEAVGRLAGGVAHDFNNLLTVITGRTELLLLRLPPDDPRRRDIELVRKTADRASSLTHQLLAFSRKQMLQPRVLDLNGVAATMAQMLKPLIGETIELITLLDPSLGRVKADPAQIEQILMNLAVNARDAMPQGGRLTIQTANVELDDAFVEAHPGSSIGAHAMMRVRDTGTGMSAVVQAHVFEPFFTTKGVGKGTGLGLATVYGIVKQHGGYVGIESAQGEGTTVSVYLARVAATADGPSELEPDAPRLAASGTVLVVEDEAELRELTAEVLGLAGYVVLSAASPSEALEISRAYRRPIQLLLTDVVMPEMSGRNLAELLLSAHPGMKVLYMSGYTDDTIVHHGVLDPGTTLLQKPFTPDGLTRMVGDVLHR